MDLQKNITKERKWKKSEGVDEKPISEIIHASKINALIDDQLERVEVPEDWQSKSFFIHLTSMDSGEMAYCIVEGRHLSARQYKILFAIQMQVEIRYEGISKVLEWYVSSWFFERETLLSFWQQDRKDKKGITWDEETFGCFFRFHADLPDAGCVYAVVDSEF